MIHVGAPRVTSFFVPAGIFNPGVEVAYSGNMSVDIYSHRFVTIDFGVNFSVRPVADYRPALGNV